MVASLALMVRASLPPLEKLNPEEGFFVQVAVIELSKEMYSLTPFFITKSQVLSSVVPSAHDTVMEQRKKITNVASRCSDLSHLCCLLPVELDRQVVPVCRFFIFLLLY